MASVLVGKWFINRKQHLYGGFIEATVNDRFVMVRFFDAEGSLWNFSSLYEIDKLQCSSGSASCDVEIYSDEETAVSTYQEHLRLEE